MTIFIDFETYSPVDLKKSSSINYIMHPNFEINCLSYIVDEEDPIIIKGFEYEEYKKLNKLLMSADIVVAHNVMFDIAIWNFRLTENYGFNSISLSKVRDTLYFARYLRLPLNLKSLAIFLNCFELKDESGVDLIKEVKKYRSKNKEIPQLILENLCIYCVQDTRTLREIYKKLMMAIPRNEIRVMIETLKINFRGVPINTKLIKSWIEAIKNAKIERQEELKKLTNGKITTPNQTQRIKDFLEISGTLQKNDVKKLLKKASKDSLTYKILNIRALYSSSSMNRIVASENRIFRSRFYGAFEYFKAHTGRWASQGLQLQNMPRTNIDEDFLKASENQDLKYLNSLYSLPSLIKGHFRHIVSGDKLIHAIDYNKIEYLVMRYLVNDRKAVKGYADGVDFYKITASKIFHKPYDEINKFERWVGKTAELSLQYQIGAERFKSQILTENPEAQDFIDGDLDVFCQSVVQIYRRENANIQSFWWSLKRTAQNAFNNEDVEQELKINETQNINFKFSSKSKALHIFLPSKRYLIYRNFTAWDDEPMSYTEFRGDKAIEDKLYGGKLANHITQALARDILANVLIENPNLPIVSLAHDEIVFEGGDPQEFNEKMLEMPKWFWPKLKTEIKSGKYYS